MVYICGLENWESVERNIGGWKFEDITESERGSPVPTNFRPGRFLPMSMAMATTRFAE